MLKLLAALAVAVAVAVGPAAAQSDIHYGKYHALVIGNNGYRHFDKLKTAKGDAEAIADALKNDYQFQVTLLTDATRDDVMRALADFRRTLSADDNLLIYYAGHGVVDQVTERGYWLPIDAEKDVQTAWISNADVTDMLRAIRAKHILVVADSCYAGTLTRSATPQLDAQPDKTAWLARVTKLRARTVLASGGLEPVADSGGGRHSVFASAFLKALTDNRDVLEGQALYDRVKRPVTLDANQTPQYADIRQAGHDGGDFLFVRRGTGATVAALSPAASSGAPANPAVEVAFWQSIQGAQDPAMFKDYLRRFPQGTFAELARLKVRELETQHAAVVPRAPAPTAAPAAPSAKAFDGRWKLNLNLGGQCFALTNDALVIAESKASSKLFHPLAGGHELSGFVLDDGTITMRLSGPAARGDFKGKIDGVKGSGDAIVIHSDGDCSGKWTIAKQ